MGEMWSQALESIIYSKGRWLLTNGALIGVETVGKLWFSDKCHPQPRLKIVSWNAYFKFFNSLVRQFIRKTKKLTPFLRISSSMGRYYFASKKPHKKCSNHGRYINQYRFLLLPDNSQETYDKG